MAIQININADMAEGYGPYDIGNDRELLKVVRSANVACGMHGGDPGIIHDVIVRAGKEGVSIGAHPGFNDLWGFGRRRIDMKVDDLEYLVAYQIGAIKSMAAYSDTEVTHVKAHGALNNMACVNAGYAAAIARAIKVVDPSLIHLVMPGTEMERATRELDLPIALEAFVDRTYEDDGTLTLRNVAGSVIRDPETAVQRAVHMVLNKVIVSRHGKAMPTEFHSLCVHGDEPTSLSVASAVREALEGAGVDIVTLPEMVSSGFVRGNRSG